MCNAYHEHQFTNTRSFHHVDQFGVVWYRTRRECPVCGLVDYQWHSTTDKHNPYGIIWDAHQRAQARRSCKQRPAYVQEAT